MRDRNESDRSTVTPVEGVRILGAKETPTVRRDEAFDPDALDLAAMAHDEPEHRPSFTHRAPVPIVASAEGDSDDRLGQASFDTPFDSAALPAQIGDLFGVQVDAFAGAEQRWIVPRRRSPP